MTDQNLAFSQDGDRVFSALAFEFPQARRWRLLIEQRLEARKFEAIRAAMIAYIGCVTGHVGALNEQEALEILLQRRSTLPNYTRGGMLAPTREHTLEWNMLHRRLVHSLSEFCLGDHIEGIDLPVNVRLVYGDVDASREQAPFSSTKLHSDVWAGVPTDASVVVLPVLGDIDDITIECFEMPREQELDAMRALSDYDEGRHVEAATAYSDCRMKHGHLYIADARLMHRTVRKRRSGVRLSLDFRFRYNDAKYRALTPPITRGGPDSVDTRVPYGQWCSVGSDTLMVFDDTLADLRLRQSAGNSSPVNNATYRLLPLARSEKGA